MNTIDIIFSALKFIMILTVPLTVVSFILYNYFGHGKRYDLKNNKMSEELKGGDKEYESL